MTIGWQSGMETGAPLLDAQHRSLVERAAALVATIERGSERPVVERALRDFGDYSVRHFSMDEDCTLRGSCPALEWNGIARAELIRIMAGFRQSYERGGATPDAGREPFLRALRLGRPLHPRPRHHGPTLRLRARASREQPAEARIGSQGDQLEVDEPGRDHRQGRQDTPSLVHVAALQGQHGCGFVRPKKSSRIDPAWCSSHARRASAADSSGVNRSSATPGTGRSMARMRIALLRFVRSPPRRPTPGLWRAQRRSACPGPVVAPPLEPPGNAR